MTQANEGSLGAAVAEAAVSLIGTRYRLHGRDPAHGLDCVGLVEAALREAGCDWRAPTGYSLRSVEIEPKLAALGAVPLARIACMPPDRPGDVLLLRAGPAQVHLAISGPYSAHAPDLVHAHAGLRRVVRLSCSPGWPVLARWRAT